MLFRSAGETTSLRDDLIKHDENVVANVLLDINKRMENENEQEVALEKNIDAEFEKTKVRMYNHSIIEN